MKYIRIFCWILMTGIIAAGCGGSGTVQTENFTISAVQISPTSNSVTISWEVSLPAKGVVYYAPSGASLDSIAPDTSQFILNLSVAIENLASQTQYNFSITAWTENGETETTGIITFTTLAKTQNEPVISSLTITSISDTSAAISWYTDELADSRIYYDTTSTYNDSVVIDTLTLSHSVSLNNLTAKTLYYFQAASQDSEGYMGVSPDTSFTTIGRVTVTLQDTIITLGDTIQYPVSIIDALDLQGLEYYLRYNTGILKALDITADSLFASQTGIFQFMFSIDSTQGLIYNAIAWDVIFQGYIPIGTNADGEGIIAYIKFAAKSTGTSDIPFTPDSTIFLDIYFQNIVGATQNGQIIVQ